MLHFRMALVPATNFVSRVVPILFLVASVAMVVNALWTDPVNTGITFAIILAGIPVYFMWRAWSGRTLGASAEGATAD